MAHGVVRTDLMFGTDVRAGLVSVKYMGSGSTATAIDNGCVVLLDGLMTGEREVFKGVTPAATSDLAKVVLIASPEVMYDEKKHNLDEFENEAGKICRGYVLHSGDIFSVTADCLANATPAVGQVIELKAGVKLNNVASATASSTVVGKIIDKNVVGRHTYYAIKVD